MRIIESCAKCLFDKQKHLSDDPEYLAEVKHIIDSRLEGDTSPYLVYLFARAYEKRFGKKASYRDVKKKYNDLVLSMEQDLRTQIESAPDPLEKAFAFARIGNYIDFGAMNVVNETDFLALFQDCDLNERDRLVFESFRKCCTNGKRFLLIADNCGEIVLDRLFLEQIRKSYPHLTISVMVRGEEVLNDVTPEDAIYARVEEVADIISNGNPVAGTVYDLLSEEAKKALDEADVIFAKGQGNYESLCRQGRHIFYSFLCKCDLFTSRFQVPLLTGIFVEEKNG